MSRSGRPSVRGAHKRNLVGPDEILERIEAAGGIPDSVIEDLKQPRPRNPRSEVANEAAVNAVLGASELLASKGIDHEMGERRGPKDPDPGAAVAREMAWIISVTNAMKESVPRKQWCRHMRAADPHLGEIRTVAMLSAGVWRCADCMRELGQERGMKELATNPWPDECDLCGAEIEPGHFNEVAFNIPGCFVNCTVCDRCADFMRTKMGDDSEAAAPGP